MHLLGGVCFIQHRVIVNLCDVGANSPEHSWIFTWGEGLYKIAYSEYLNYMRTRNGSNYIYHRELKG